MPRRPDELEREIEKWRAVARSRPERIDPVGAGQESVWDYPRPPRVEPSPLRITVEYAGVTLADTTRALRVLETSSPPVYYLPPADVRTQYLEPTDHSTLCEWKGVARYWSARVGQRVAEAAAWSYPEPLAGFESIRGHLAFHAGVLDACTVGEWRVTPQPGDYYGGWITPNVVGPFKGAPGSEGW